MTREEFSNIAKGMKAIYASQNFMPDKDSFDVWYMLLAEYDYKQVSVATKTYMTTERFPPVPADIINKIHSINEAPTEVSEMSVWNKVMKAIGNSNYNAETEFEKLDDITKAVLGSPSALRSMASNNEFNEDVEKSLFMRSYKNELEKQKRIARMPQEVRTMIAEKKDEVLQIGENRSGGKHESR